MKVCPKCNQTYTDEGLNFCLNDGEYLMQKEDDAPPTIFMNEPRITNQTNWQTPPYQPPAQWQNQPQSMQNQAFGGGMMLKQQDQTLPIVSLVLGVLSLFLICCYGGFWLGIPAMVVGYLGMTNADKDPNRYTGKGMAIAGMIIGGVSLLAAIGIIILGILGNLGR
ncbi:MAG TPA: DUF4190 domain-containing protein [Pyrinomonadaceae bacterium]|nr:DUF4190 domain-containing protein [Pyrinomonadaceae bacterium]